MMVVMNLTIVGVIWFGGIRIESGGMQIGDLMAYIQYVTMIMMALVMASILFVMIPRATVSANRINEVLEMDPTSMAEGSQKANIKPGTLVFDDVRSIILEQKNQRYPILLLQQTKERQLQ